jgi:hypothetical protein
MSTPELRKKIIAKVRATNSARLLREIDLMLGLPSGDLPVFQTTPEQKKAIAKSRVAVKKGRVHSAHEVKKAVKEWLTK